MKPHIVFTLLSSLLLHSCSGVSNPYDKPTYAYGTPEDSLAASSDLVIDGCRITYKGKPLPLGGTAQDHLSVFGIPTDTVSVKDGERCLYWGNIGFRACGGSEFWTGSTWKNRPRLIFHYQTKSYLFPKIRSTSTFGIRPFGRFTTDDDHNKEIVLNAFRYTADYVPGGSSEVTMDLDPNPRLHVKLIENGADKLIEMKWSYPTMTGNPSYPEIFEAIPASCKAK